MDAANILLDCLEVGYDGAPPLEGRDAGALSPVTKIDLGQWHGQAPARLVIIDGTCYAVAVLAGAEPKYRQEFPDFPAEDMPVEAFRWEDHSWHNEACPCFYLPGNETLRVFIDYADPTLSEFPEERRTGDLKRFSIHPLEDGHVCDKPLLLHTDDWNEVLAALIGETFAANLREELNADTMVEVQRRNAAQTDAGICHSHDFCDANMPMSDAFEAVMGRSVLPDDGPPADADCDLWNAAWDYAKARHLTVQGN